ncbi:MAG: hypothetical protein V1646_04040 [bacterium]
MKKILGIILIGIFAIQGTAWGYDEKTLENDIEGCNTQAIMDKSPKVKPVVQATLINNPSLLKIALDKKDMLDKNAIPAKKKDQTRLAKQKTNIVEIISYFLEILNAQDATNKEIQKIRVSTESQLREFAKDHRDKTKIVANFLRIFGTTTKPLPTIPADAKLKAELKKLKESLNFLQKKLNALNAKLNALQTKLA